MISTPTVMIVLILGLEARLSREMLESDAT